MRMLKEEFGEALKIEWRAFMLQPTPRRRRLEDFRQYTKRWQEAADEPDSGEFCIWSSDEGPPSHSLPPHRVAKAAARVSEAAFETLHHDLLRAFFRDSRDITNPGVLAELWERAGLAPADMALAETSEIEELVLSEHGEAVACGASGAPSFRTADNDLVLTGAHPMQLFRRWITKALARA